MLYKFFTTKYTTLPNDLPKLREEFGKFFYKEGQYDGKQGIWCLSSLDKIPDAYATPKKSKKHQDTLFFSPKELPSDIQAFLDANVVKSNNKIKVELASGYNIYLIPATAEPRNVAFGLFGTEEEPSASEYALLAFELFNEMDKKSLKTDDVRVSHLITLGLSKSYSLPLDVLNWTKIFTTEDVESIFLACVGVDMASLEKKEEISSSSAEKVA